MIMTGFICAAIVRVCSAVFSLNTPVHTDGAEVERVKSIGVHVTKDLSWCKHTNTSHEEGMATPTP